MRIIRLRMLRITSYMSVTDIGLNRRHRAALWSQDWRRDFRLRPIWAPGSDCRSNNWSCCESQRSATGHDTDHRSKQEKIQKPWFWSGASQTKYPVTPHPSLLLAVTEWGFVSPGFTFSPSVFIARRLGFCSWRANVLLEHNLWHIRKAYCNSWLVHQLTFVLADYFLSDCQSKSCT